MKRQLNCCFFFYMTLTGRHLHLLFKARADQACLLRPFAAKGGTMLQKLSKFEVKAWLCWNLIILLALIFYVKSNFGEFKRSKNVDFDNFRGSQFWFLVNLSDFQVPNLPKIQSSESLKLPKMTFLDRLNSPKFDFTQNRNSSKIIKFQQSLALTSNFEIS